MKTLKIFAVAAIVFSIVACNSTKTVAQEGDGEQQLSAKQLLPSKAYTDSVSYLMGINFGQFLKGYRFGDKLNYSEIKKGMTDFLKATGTPQDTNFVKQFKISPEEMNRLFSDYLAQMASYNRALATEKENKFLAANAKKDGISVTESGLQYTITEAGNDVKPEGRDTVFVHYKGSLIDGIVFDQTPAEGPSVMLTLNRVVPGFSEGLKLIGEGGKVTLYVPSELGYGQSGNQVIEPNSTLIFDVELDSVKRYVAPVEAAE